MNPIATTGPVPPWTEEDTVRFAAALAEAFGWPRPPFDKPENYSPHCAVSDWPESVGTKS